MIFQLNLGLGGTICLYLSTNLLSPCLIAVCHDIQHLPHNIEFVNSPDNVHLELTI